jgi:hypothetical protein
MEKKKKMQKSTYLLNLKVDLNANIFIHFNNFIFIDIMIIYK